MNDDHLINRLSKIGETTYDTENTKASMRRALLRRHARLSIGVGFGFHFYRFFSTNRIYVPAGVLVVMLLVIIGSSSSRSASTLATNLLEESFAKTMNLDDGSRASIEARIDGTIESVYKEAIGARDLAIIDEETAISYGVSTTPIVAMAKVARTASPSSNDDTYTMASFATTEENASAEVSPFATAPAVDTNVSVEEETIGLRYLSYTNDVGDRFVIAISPDGSIIFRIRVSGDE